MLRPDWPLVAAGSARFEFWNFFGFAKFNAEIFEGFFVEALDPFCDFALVVNHKERWDVMYPVGVADRKAIVFMVENGWDFHFKSMFEARGI